jgi:hypothetical protein
MPAVDDPPLGVTSAFACKPKQFLDNKKVQSIADANAAHAVCRSPFLCNPRNVRSLGNGSKGKAFVLTQCVQLENS